MENKEDLKRQIKRLNRQLNKVDSDLKSARNWGVYDLFGGKTASSFFKHRKIRRAENRLADVNRELRFLEENIHLPGDINFSGGVFNKYMDIFVDHTLSDIYTQGKIKDGRKTVKLLKKDLNKLYKSL